MIGAMAEEIPRRGVDSVGAAAEIDAVEIKLEDLVLAELAFEREREDRFLDLADEAAVVGQEDVARELLGDRRGRADLVALDDRRAERAGDADRIDADVAAEAPVLGRDHRRAHLRRDLVVGQPAAEARAHRHQHLAVGGADADHLAEVGALGELGVARKVGGGDGDRDDEREKAEQRRINKTLQDADQGRAPFERRVRGACGPSGHAGIESCGARDNRRHAHLVRASARRAAEKVSRALTLF